MSAQNQFQFDSDHNHQSPSHHALCTPPSSPAFSTMPDADINALIPTDEDPLADGLIDDSTQLRRAPARSANASSALALSLVERAAEAALGAFRTIRPVECMPCDVLEKITLFYAHFAWTAFALVESVLWALAAVATTFLQMVAILCAAVAVLCLASQVNALECLT